VIILEHLSGKEFMLNADLIERIDENPDTMIVLTNGGTTSSAPRGTRWCRG